MIGEHADGLELVVVEEVGFVDFSGRPRRKRRSDLGFHVACMFAMWGREGVRDPGCRKARVSGQVRATR